MDNIKISVIVPVYNTSKFLEKCIRSIMKQNFKEIEIICVNDGSTDNSLEILEMLQKEDKRIVIINKENGGSSPARNAALKIAKGKYCLNIDSDDWIEQGYFKLLYERAEKDDLDITLSNIIFDYLDSPEKNHILNDLNISNTEIITGDEYINVFLKENFHGYTCNKLIKTELYKNNNIVYNEKIFMFEDVQLILRLSKFAKKVGKINDAFYHYVQHQTNGSKNISIKKIKDKEECYNTLLEYFENDREKILKLKNIKYQSMILSLKGSFILKRQTEYSKIQKRILKEIKKENANLLFLKFKEATKSDVICYNILKIFPSVKVMNLLFTIYEKVIGKLRIIKNRRKNQ